MVTPNDNEQWLLDGDCTKCRRDPYCEKECSAYKKWFSKKLREAMSNAIDKYNNREDEENVSD